jgi:hypothetical protein
VTEPVARPSARRTVRVATALVAGQAALCAVIGWITFGATHGPARTASAPVDPLAGAPLVIPPPSMLPPVLPKTGPRTSPAVTAEATATSIDRTTAPRSRRTARHSSPPPPAAPRPPAPPPVAPLPAPTAPTTTSTDPPPSPPASDDPQLIVPTPTPEIQQPVVAREPCDPENALGETAAGVALVCVHGADGTLRWQIS